MEEGGNPQFETSQMEDEVISDVVIETGFDDDDSEEEQSDASDSNDTGTGIDRMAVRPVTVMVEQEQDFDDEPEDLNIKVAKSGELYVTRTGRKRSSNSNFMDKAALLSVLLKSTSTLNQVPHGAKIGRAFLLDDSINFFKGRRRTGKHTFQVDEFKRWDAVSLKKHFYMYRDGEFKYVDFIGGEYWLHKSSPDGKGSKQPMPVQPQPHEILVMRKMYGVVPGVVRRRICYIEELPAGVVPKQKDLSVVEYGHAPLEPSEVKHVKLETSTSSDAGAEFQTQDKKSGKSNVEPQDIAKVVTIGSAVMEEIINSVGGDNKGIFFDRNQAIDILLQAEMKLDEIPVGVKENRFYIVCNEDNHHRQLQGKRRVYVDDCGVWKHLSMKTQWYARIKDGHFASVDRHDGRFKFSNTQLRFQYETPQVHDIMRTRKVYGYLKRAEEYKRRITWIDQFPDGIVPKQEHIALVEYIGKYPAQEAPHGNKRKTDDAVPYVRTPLSVMKKMKEMVVHKSVKEVMEEMPDLGISPRGVRQLQNLRYRSKFRIGPGAARSETHNDEMRELLNMVQTNPYVQQITYTKHKAPVIIGYTPQQVNSWKYHCQRKSGLIRALGVDRTINLGPVCLTILTYPHPNLLNRKTGEQAIMMGPVFFHVEKSVHCFSFLFNHLKMCLAAVDNADVDHIGIACSSEEKTFLTDAIRQSFPISAIRLCPEHLKVDLMSFLLSVISLTKAMADKLVDEIFTALMSCAEEYEFDLKVMQLQSDYDATNPTFGNYFKKLAQNIRHSLWRPTVNHTPIVQWSKESCETLGNLITSSASWSRPSISELVVKLQELSLQQEQEELLALYDEGCYMLAPHAKRYLVDKADYDKKTTKQKARLAESLRKYKPGVPKVSFRTMLEDTLKDTSQSWDDEEY